jgi:hypothetical protein
VIPEQHLPRRRGEWRRIVDADGQIPVSIWWQVSQDGEVLGQPLSQRFRKHLAEKLPTVSLNESFVA